jgi:hypothetical protein
LNAVYALSAALVAISSIAACPSVGNVDVVEVVQRASGL